MMLKIVFLILIQIVITSSYDYDEDVLVKSCEQSENLAHAYLREAKRGLEENVPNVRAAQMAVLYAAISSNILGNESHPGNQPLFKELVRVLESTNGAARRSFPPFVLRPREGRRRERVAIVSLCDYDPIQTKLASLSIHNKVEYTKRHGYELFVETKSLDNTRPHAWSKIRAMSKYLETGRFDWVMWMDCDSFFMNVNLRLEHVLDNAYDLIISEDGAMLNSGVFFIRDTAWSRDFLTRVYGSETNPLIQHPWWEQASMMFWLNYDGDITQQHVKYLSQRAINSYPPEIASQLRDPITGNTLHGEYQEGDFIISFSGCKIYFEKSKCERFFAHYHGVASRYFLLNHGTTRQNQFQVHVEYPLRNQKITRSESEIKIRLKSLHENTEGPTLCVSFDSKDGVGTCTVLERDQDTISFSMKDLTIGRHEIRTRVMIDGMTTSNVDIVSFEVWDASGCTIFDPQCFNMSRCMNDRHEFRPTLYIYPDSDNDENDAMTKSAYRLQMSRLHHSLLSTFRDLGRQDDDDNNNNIVIVENPQQACLLLTSVDTLCLHNSCSNSNTSRHLASLPHWNNGRNHIVIHLSDHSPSFDFGAAILFRSSVSETESRTQFDVTFPLLYYRCWFPPLLHLNRFDTSKILTNKKPRPVTLSFRGALYDVPETHHAYVRKEIARYFHNNKYNDVIIETYCVVNATECLTGESRVFEFSRSCSEFSDSSSSSSIGSSNNYDELLLSSKFVLIPPGEGHHSYRLYEALQAGAVPVIVGNAALPFGSFSSTEWTKSALRIDHVSRLSELVSYLREMPQEKWLEMSESGVRLFRKLFASESVVCRTAIKKLLHERIRKHVFPVDTTGMAISIQQPWTRTQYEGPFVSIVATIKGLNDDNAETHQWSVCVLVSQEEEDDDDDDVVEEKRCVEIQVPTKSIQPGSRNEFRLGDMKSGQYRVRAELVLENNWVVARSSSILFEIVSRDELQVLRENKLKRLSSSDLEMRLNRLQRISSSCRPCEDDDEMRKLVTCYDPVNYAIHGFGARFQSHAASLALALLTNRTLFTAPLRLSSTSSSSFQGWIDLFKSRNGCCDEDKITTTSCRISHAANQWMSLDALDQRNKIAYTGFYHPRALIRNAVKSLERSSKDMDMESRASWFGRIQRWLWQPVQSVISPIEPLLNRIKENKSPVIGIHIRLGDAVSRTDRANVTLSNYLAAAATLQSELRRYKNLEVQTVYVASDSASALRSVQTSSDWHSFFDTILVNEIVSNTLPENGWDNEDGGEDEDEDDEFHRKIVKSRHVLNGIVQDITLLSECDVLIGTCMSQVSRMAAELMVDRMIAPPIAMDLALCRSFPAHFVDIEMEWRSYMGVGV